MAVFQRVRRLLAVLHIFRGSLLFFRELGGCWLAFKELLAAGCPSESWRLLAVLHRFRGCWLSFRELGGCWLSFQIWRLLAVLQRVKRMLAVIHRI